MNTQVTFTPAGGGRRPRRRRRRAAPSGARLRPTLPIHPLPAAAPDRSGRALQRGRALDRRLRVADRLPASRPSRAPARLRSRCTCPRRSGRSHPATWSSSTAAPVHASALAVVTGTSEVLWAGPVPRTRRISAQPAGHRHRAHGARLSRSRPWTPTSLLDADGADPTRPSPSATGSRTWARSSGPGDDPRRPSRRPSTCPRPTTAARRHDRLPRRTRPAPASRSPSAAPRRRGPGQVTLTGAGTPPSTIPATTPLAVPLQLLLDVVAGLARHDRDRRGAGQRERRARRPDVHALRSRRSRISPAATAGRARWRSPSTGSTGRRSRASTARPPTPGCSWSRGRRTRPSPP